MNKHIAPLLFACLLALSACGPKNETAQQKMTYLYPVAINGAYGFMDSTGVMKIAPAFTGARDFHEGLAGVEYNGQWGFIDTTGGWVISPRYKNVRDFSEAYAGAEIIGGWGYIDPTSAWRIPPSGAMHILYPFRGRLAAVHRMGWWFFMRPNMKEPYGKRFLGARPFSEGKAAVKKMASPRLYGYITRDGKPVIAHRFDDALDFSEGVAPVMTTGSGWGYIDDRGGWTIKPKYSAAQPFSGGLGSVCTGGELTNPHELENRWNSMTGGTWKYIRKDGTTAFTVGTIAKGYAAPFRGPLARIEEEGAWYYVNRRGERVDPKPAS